MHIQFFIFYFLFSVFGFSHVVQLSAPRLSFRLATTTTITITITTSQTIAEASCMLPVHDR